MKTGFESYCQVYEDTHYNREDDYIYAWDDRDDDLPSSGASATTDSIDIQESEAVLEMEAEKLSELKSNLVEELKRLKTFYRGKTC